MCTLPAKLPAAPHTETCSPAVIKISICSFATESWTQHPGILAWGRRTNVALDDEIVATPKDNYYEAFAHVEV